MSLSYILSNGLIADLDANVQQIDVTGEFSNAPEGANLRMGSYDNKNFGILDFNENSINMLWDASYDKDLNQDIAGHTGNVFGIQKIQDQLRFNRDNTAVKGQPVNPTTCARINGDGSWTFLNGLHMGGDPINTTIDDFGDVAGTFTFSSEFAAPQTVAYRINFVNDIATLVVDGLAASATGVAATYASFTSAATGLPAGWTPVVATAAPVFIFDNASSDNVPGRAVFDGSTLQIFRTNDAATPFTGAGALDGWRGFSVSYRIA